MRLGPKSWAVSARRALPREKVAAGLRCLILLTVFMMARTQAGPRTRLFDLVVSVGAAYVLVSTFLPWARYDMRRATLVVLAADILLISALLYAQTGVYSEYYLLYYLPILHASVRLNFRDAVGTCLLSAASYLLVALVHGPGATVTTSVVSRVLTFAVSASVMAGFFVMLAREQSAFRRLSDSYQEAIRGRSRFLSHISHEFRTPLTAIVGFSELLYEHESGLDPERRREYLVIVREQSQHLARMIEDMLDLSRIDEGRLALKREAIHLPDVAASALALLEDPAVRERVEISEESRGRPAWADREEVEQVIARLLHAALSLYGGTAPISVETGDTKEGDVQVSIRLPEAPTSAEELAAVSTALEGERAGEGPPDRDLGLAVARALVELHGGRIWVEESGSGGAAICFTLPAYRREASGPRVIVAAEAGRRSGAAGAEADGESADRGRRPARTAAHAGQPESVG